MTVTIEKPLLKRAYGSIAHLPGSKIGQHDKYIHEGQARILTEKKRDKHDTIVVQEKLDGTCVAVAKIDGVIVPLIRRGYPAIKSHYEQHHLFAAWAFERQSTFDFILEEGERIVGEWLAQAHGIRYDLGKRLPFVPFDIMRGDERLPHDVVQERTVSEGFDMPPLLHVGWAFSVESAIAALGERGFYGATEKPEGVVYRCERNGRVEFLAKYVRQDFVPGKFLKGCGGTEDVWNWRPIE